MLNATTTDTGEYTVVVKNESGSVQSSARLIVNPRKEIELEFGHSSSLRQVEMSQQQTVHRVVEEELPARPEFVKPLVASAEKPEGSNIHLEAQVCTLDPYSQSYLNKFLEVLKLLDLYKWLCIALENDSVVK